MRFLLDNDVDILVARVIRAAGHDCWTAADAGLAGPESANDDEVSVYAHDKGAVVVTHDREFTKRRMRRTFGRHVWLRCEQPDAAEAVKLVLDELVKALESLDELVVVVSARGGVEISPPRWK